MTVGRNDPCPCGSGKKYKKCCLPGHEVISLDAARVDRLYRGLWEKLADYMMSPTNADETWRGSVRFSFDLLEDEGDVAEQQVKTAADWVAFAYRPSGTGPDTTLCGRYAAEGDDLTDQEREILHAWASSAPGFFRVQAVSSGEVELSRLPDGHVITVREKTELVVGAVVSVWVLPVLSTYRFGFHLDAVPDVVVDPLLHLLAVDFELFQRQQPDATWHDLYRTCWPRLCDAVTMAIVYGPKVRQIAAPPGPAVKWDGKQVPTGGGGKWHEVMPLVQRALESEYEELPPECVDGALRLWGDATLALEPRVLHPKTWAAGVVYLYRNYVLDDGVTQAEVAHQLGVSVVSIGIRSREMASALNVTALDPRYTDVLDPVVRYDRMSRWNMLLGGLPIGRPTDGAMPPNLHVVAEPALRSFEREIWGSDPEDSARRRGSDLVDEAWQASGTRRGRLARQALKAWPDAADAYVMLGQEAQAGGKLTEARQMFEDGVRAGEHALGAEFFTENVGHFYGILESRPYMRARASLAGCLWSQGQHEAAVAHYEEMLRLNPNDNQGIRYLLAACYLTIGDDKRLGQLLARYEDDAAASFTYTSALWQYRRSGPGAKADALLREAIRGNPHVPAYVLGLKRLPPELPEYIDFGGDLEAVAYAAEFGEGWRQTTGAREWLRKLAR